MIVITKKGLKYILEVDGYCNKKTFKIFSDAGAEMPAMGTGLFNLDPKIENAWAIMKKQINEEIKK